MKIVSLNLRFAYHEEMNNQKIREPRIVEFVRDTRPAAMGTQECEKFWRERLVATIGEMGYIPVQTEAVGPDGKAAFKNFIWYDSNSCELVEGGALWLSETPDVPSKGFASRFYISAGYAVLKNKESGESFAYVNTHLDVHSEENRKNEIGVIKAKISELSAKGYPVFITGDFNDVEGSAVYLEMTKELADARKTAIRSTEINTFNGYNSEDDVIPVENYKRIDFCFYTENAVKINGFSVVDKWADGYMSDHNALIIDFAL